MLEAFKTGACSFASARAFLIARIWARLSSRPVVQTEEKRKADGQSSDDSRHGEMKLNENRKRSKQQFKKIRAHKRRKFFRYFVYTIMLLTVGIAFALLFVKQR